MSLAALTFQARQAESCLSSAMRRLGPVSILLRRYRLETARPPRFMISYRAKVERVTLSMEPAARSPKTGPVGGDIGSDRAGGSPHPARTRSRTASRYSRPRYRAKAHPYHDKSP